MRLDVFALLETIIIVLVAFMLAAALMLVLGWW
jgi:hypothetical protein